MDFLLAIGYEVHGIVRRSSTFNTSRIDHILHSEFVKLGLATFHYGDLCDGSNLARLMRQIKPDEIYNLGAQSHVKVSFDLPEYTADVTGLGSLRMIEAIRESGIDTKFYQASSSEMFGRAREVPQSERTPFYPVSPYACAKVYSYWMTRGYRENYNMFACNGILFNHEGPRRNETFVTRKITSALSRISLGSEEVLCLGNLEAKRDWGYAPEYVYGMWQMLQADTPDDYVLATGESHSVREFVNYTAECLGLRVAWEGSGLDEKGIDAETGDQIIAIDPKYIRPGEVDILLGDATKAKTILGWEPKVKFEDLVQIMTREDYDKACKI